MAVTLKVQCEDGEVYRLTLTGQPTFEGVIAAVLSARPEMESFLKPVAGVAKPTCLKYADDEGDLCTLTLATFNDFLTLHGGENARLLKLKLTTPRTLLLPPPTATCESVAGSEMTCDASSAPPGLEEAGEEENDCRGGGGGCPGGGPRKLIHFLKMLRDSGVLTAEMFASLAVQWLPMLTQRVARKVDKINHMARDGMPHWLRRIVEVLKEQTASIPDLAEISSKFEEILNAVPGPVPLGETILDLLKTLRGMAFEAKARFAERLAGHLLPLLDEFSETWGQIGGWGGWGGGGWDFPPPPPFFPHCPPPPPPSPVVHHGIECDCCGASPIFGPRFKCTLCPNYDLCGNCYPRKMEVHGNCPGAQKDFQCILMQAGGGPFGGKGKGKWKGCFGKGWPGGKAFGKGFFGMM